MFRRYQLFKYHKGKPFFFFFTCVGKERAEGPLLLFLTEISVTKNQYARDDPAFLVLLSFWLCCKSS